MNKQKPRVLEISASGRAAEGNHQGFKKEKGFFKGKDLWSGY